MTHTEALKLSRRAIKNLISSSHLKDPQPWRDARQDSVDALTAIKEALAHPTSGDYALGYAEGFNDACKKPAKPQQELCPSCKNGSIYACTCTFKPAQPQQEIDWKDMYEKQKRRAEMWIAKYEADIKLPERAVPVTAQPQQEPVAIYQFRSPHCSDWYDGVPDHHDGYGPYEVRTLYASPPQRPWVGLTFEDKGRVLANDFGGSRTDCMDEAEKILREKNA